MMKSIDFLRDEIKGKIRSFVPLTWNGYRITKNAKALTSGQYIDLNYFLSNQKAPKNFPDIMAILMQPTRFGFVRKKEPLEHGDIREAAKQLPMTVVKPLTDFFLSASDSLEKTTQAYSLKKMKNEMENLRGLIVEVSAKDTAGLE